MATVVRSFFVDTTKGLDLVKIIHEVRRVVKEANTENGTATIVVPNPGAGIAVLDPGEKPEDLRKTLEPHAASGLIRYLLPKSLSVPYEKGKMLTEPWQEIFLIDYDPSARRREFKVHVFGESPPPAPAPGPGGMKGAPKPHG